VRAAAARRNRNPEAQARKNEARKVANDPNRRDANRSGALKKYGLTPERFDALYQAQGGLCCICGQPPSGKGIAGVLHVDHDHETGQIRGLLCMRCNTGIGCLGESVDRMRMASEYLLSYRDVLSESIL